MSPLAVLLIIGSAIVGTSAKAQETGPATLTSEGAALCAKYNVDCTKDYPWRTGGHLGASALIWAATTKGEFDFICGNCTPPFTSAYSEPATCVLIQTQPAVWGTITNHLCKLVTPRKRDARATCELGEECS